MGLPDCQHLLHLLPLLLRHLCHVLCDGLLVKTWIRLVSFEEIGRPLFDNFFNLCGTRPCSQSAGLESSFQVGTLACPWMACCSWTRYAQPDKMFTMLGLSGKFAMTLSSSSFPLPLVHLVDWYDVWTIFLSVQLLDPWQNWFRDKGILSFLVQLVRSLLKHGLKERLFFLSQVNPLRLFDGRHVVDRI